MAEKNKNIMNEKSVRNTTIEISIENYDKIHSLKQRIEKILKKPISLNKTLGIVLAVKELDQQLSELMLE